MREAIWGIWAWRGGFKAFPCTALLYCGIQEKRAGDWRKTLPRLPFGANPPKLEEKDSEERFVF